MSILELLVVIIISWCRVVECLCFHFTTEVSVKYLDIACLFVHLFTTEVRHKSRQQIVFIERFLLHFDHLFDRGDLLIIIHRGCFLACMIVVSRAGKYVTKIIRILLLLIFLSNLTVRG